MKKLIISFAIVVMLFNLCHSSYAEESVVKGYYDEKNDWFVYEWKDIDGDIIVGIDDPPNKIRPVIKSAVIWADNETYLYMYEVSNLKGAVQLLNGFNVPYLSEVYDAKAPLPEGEWFMSKYRDYNEWHWAKVKEEPYGIPAGQVVDGFSFKSKGLPVMVEAYAYGERRKRFNMPGDYDSEEVNAAFGELYDKIEEQYADKFKDVVVKVVGPGEVPKDFNALTFIDSIITMKHEAADLGWITNDGIVKSLDAKLDSAKKAIQGGNMTTAKNVLEAFIKEVEAQGCESYDSCNKGKHIKPEAWALLKFNAEYLLSKL